MKRLLLLVLAISFYLMPSYKRQLATTSEIETFLRERGLCFKSYSERPGGERFQDDTQLILIFNDSIQIESVRFTPQNRENLYKYNGVIKITKELRKVRSGLIVEDETRFFYGKFIIFGDPSYIAVVKEILMEH